MTKALTREQMIAALMEQIAREDFAAYCRRVNKKDDYAQPAHVKKLIEYLEMLERREITRLIVTMPPRSSKSTHVSQFFPSYWLGKHPADGVILGSYSDQLATDNGRLVRDYIAEKEFPFPTSIRADVKAAGRWQTGQGGGLIAVGVGTNLTGWPFPGRLAVVDDPMKGRDDAESENIRNSTWNWWMTTLMTRIASDGVVCLTGTRWHEDDLIGRVLNSEGQSEWTVLNIPYEAEEGDMVGRKVGERLSHWGIVPTGLSAYDYSALYQQRPTSAGGGVFKKEWMQRRYCTCGVPSRCGFRPLPPMTGRWMTIQTADLGGKQGVGHDPSALATWGWDGISKYVLDYTAKQDEYVDVKARFLASYRLHQPRMVYIEDATWAQPLISDMRAAGVRVHPVPAVGSKWTRADSVSNEFEGGMVVLPESAPWLDSWINEHLGFPNAAHDEAVDTTSMALTHFKSYGTRRMPVTADLGRRHREGQSAADRIKAKLLSYRK